MNRTINRLLTRAGPVVAIALLACGPTTYTDNRDVFRENIEARIDRMQERVDPLWTLMDERVHPDPEFSIFVGEVDAEIWELRSRLSEAASIPEAEWPDARSRITRDTRALEHRLARVRVGDYP